MFPHTTQLLDILGVRSFQLETPVFSNPALTYSQEITISLPTDPDYGVGAPRIYEPSHKYEFQSRARMEGKLKNVYYM